MIGIIDYDIGNLRSVQKAFQFVGGPELEVKFVKSPSEIEQCEKLVLPGVGAFGDCVRSLRKSGMCEAAMDWARSGKPFFGICVGFQMLFEFSEEDPGEPGLALFAGQVRRFDPKLGLKIPQIGWNTLSVTQPESSLLSGIATGDYVYFVHSYYVAPTDPKLEALKAEYGTPFTAAIIKDNVLATQFHPEKSQKAGLQLIRNFLNIKPQ